MVEKYLIITGSIIFLILGSIHLFYTFFTNRFSSRNQETEQKMKTDAPILTKETTMWNAWIGFNASHSLGAIFFGLVNIIICIQYFEFYNKSKSLLILNIVTLLFYLFLGKNYWFKIPFFGIFVSTLCFIIASILIVFK